MTKHKTKHKTKTIAAIADSLLGLETLETRNSDRLDFKEQHVSTIKAALEAAYEAGRAAKPGKAPQPIRIRVEDQIGNVQYIYRAAVGRWCCASATGTPLALAYAGIPREAECRFALEDCKTADEALAVVRRFSTSPKIELV